jgi:hypothetical protein
MFVITCWEVPQPVQATTHALVSPSRARMMGQRAAIHPSRDRLPSAEVPSLRLSQSVEPVVVNAVRHKLDYIPQTPDFTAVAVNRRRSRDNARGIIRGAKR